MIHVEKIWKIISMYFNKGKRDKGNTARTLYAIGQLTGKGVVVILDSDWATRRASRFPARIPELWGSADCPVVLRWNVSSFNRIKYNQIPFEPIFQHAVAAVLWAKNGRVWNRDQHLGSHHAGKNGGEGCDYLLDLMLGWGIFAMT